MDESVDHICFKSGVGGMRDPEYPSEARLTKDGFLVGEGFESEMTMVVSMSAVADTTEG